MMSLTFGLFTQVSGSGPLGPLVFPNKLIKHAVTAETIKEEYERQKALT